MVNHWDAADHEFRYFFKPNLVLIDEGGPEVHAKAFDLLSTAQRLVEAMDVGEESVATEGDAVLFEDLMDLADQV